MLTVNKKQAVYAFIAFVLLIVSIMTYFVKSHVYVNGERIELPSNYISIDGYFEDTTVVHFDFELSFSVNLFFVKYMKDVGVKLRSHLDIEQVKVAGVEYFYLGNYEKELIRDVYVFDDSLFLFYLEADEQPPLPLSFSLSVINELEN